MSRDPNESELKKSYRKLALQFHPDKNKAPGATEAFKSKLIMLCFTFVSESANGENEISMITINKFNIMCTSMQ